MEQSVWTFGKEKGICNHVSFPCMEIFMHLGYKKLGSWLMSWVLLKAFPRIPPRRVSQDPSQYFRSLEGSAERWRVGSRCHPGTVCSSAEAGVQRRRLARFLGAWLSTEESAAEGCNKLVSCCSCGKQSSQLVSAKQEVSCMFWAPKGTEQGEVHALTTQPSPSFGSPLSPTPHLWWNLMIWVTAASEHDWEP